MLNYCVRCGKMIHDLFTLCQPCAIKKNNENDKRIDKMIEQELIPFDLEKALEGDPVISRDGTPIIEIFYSKTLDKHGDQGVMAVSEEGKTFHEKNGKFYSKEITSDYDLFMAPKAKQKRWGVAYKNKYDEIRLAEFTCKTEEEAIKSFGLDDDYCTFLKTISFEV